MLFLLKLFVLALSVSFSFRVKKFVFYSGKIRSNSIFRLGFNFFTDDIIEVDHYSSIDQQLFPPSVESRDELFGNSLAAKLEGTRDEATKDSVFISQDGLPLGLQRYSQCEFKFSADDGLQILEEVDCFRFLVDEDDLNAAIEKGTPLKVDQLLPSTSSSSSSASSLSYPPASFILDSSIVQALSLDMPQHLHEQQRHQEQEEQEQEQDEEEEEEEEGQEQQVKTIFMDMDAFRDSVTPIIIVAPEPEEDEEASEEDLGKLLEEYSEHFRNKSLLGRLGLQSRLADNESTHKRTTIKQVFQQVVYGWWLNLQLHELLADQLGALFVIALGALSVSVAGAVEVVMHTVLQMAVRRPSLKKMLHVLMDGLGQRRLAAIAVGVLCMGAMARGRLRPLKPTV